MIRDIVDVKDKKLRKKSKEVKKFDKKLKTLVKDLKDTLDAQDNPEGVGLAAPQIGKNVRIFAMKPRNKITVIINPKIISISKAKTKLDEDHKIMEGCLSMPHFYGPIQRSKSIIIKYQDEDRKIIEKEFKGFKAHIVQHEIDHLNGTLFIDKLLEQKKPLYEYKNDEWTKVDLDY